ncbi:MAG: LemA family protein [Candidatus Moranbacteria bacterium]|nr:LemA family protein [Candidatus Moranbacteria bacterium]
MMLTWIILAVVVVVVGFAVAVYNGLIRLKNKTEEAWADIDVQLKRRYDLIPNLVETVKGYAKHEKGTFEKVAELRSEAMQAKTPGEKAKADNMLTETLKSLFAVAENYPDLKANQNFLDLQSQLSQIEETIQQSRRYYNGNVRDFNIKIETFPNNLIVGIMGFKKFEFFEVAEAKERENVKVAF